MRERKWGVQLFKKIYTKVTGKRRDTGNLRVHMAPKSDFLSGDEEKKRNSLGD